MSLVRTNRKDEGPRQQSPLALHDHRLIKLAGLLGLGNQYQFILARIIKQLGVVVAQELVCQWAFVGKIQTE